jgi:RNA processing factor Prp31
MKKIFLLLMTIYLASCGGNIPKNEKEAGELYKEITKTNFPLTEEMVVKYIATYKKLREAGPDFLKYTNGGADNGMAGFNAFEQIVKEGGFKDYADFVRTNAKIAWAFIIVQGQSGIEDFGNFKNKMKNQGDEVYQQSFAELDKMLNDPDVPAETKEQLRKTKEQLEQQRKDSYEKIENQWENDKKWAEWTVDKIKNLTSEEDMKVIKKYRKELTEVYAGVELPSVE